MAKLNRPLMSKLRILSLILFFSVFNLHAYSADRGIIDLDIWTEVTGLIPSLEKEENSYLEESEIYRRTLEDAAWIISGMIYGFHITYVPLDLAREVAEYLEVSPVASIEWGDKKLEVVDTWFKNEKISLQVRYFLDEAQIRRIKLWESNIFPDSEGIGIVSVFDGYQGRIGSIKEGIKEALRNYLRSRNTNKPREINCKILINKAPYTIMDAGGYKSRVNITIKFSEIRPYSFY